MLQVYLSTQESDLSVLLQAMESSLEPVPERQEVEDHHGNSDFYDLRACFSIASCTLLAVLSSCIRLTCRSPASAEEV